MSRTIFILWDEQDADGIHKYVGGGSYDVQWVNQRTVTRRCRWSAYSRKAMQTAREYATSEEMADKQNVRVVTRGA